MALDSFAKKLFRTVARVIPQCGMVSQAVAFNMFLAFFSSLLVMLGLMSNSLRGRSGGQLAVRLSTILPQGSWQLVSDSLLRREVNPWAWVLFGWVGTLLVGSQVMKLIMEGIHLIYDDRERHSFLGRQLRGLLLFCVHPPVEFSLTPSHLLLIARGKILARPLMGRALRELRT